MDDTRKLRPEDVISSQKFEIGAYWELEDIEARIVHVGGEDGRTFLIHYTDEEKIAYHKEHGHFPKRDFYEKVVSGVDKTRGKAEFVVEQAYSTGHGSDGGWHIEARRLNNGKYDPNGELIMFYEGGHYGNNISLDEIKIVRKMKRTFG